MIFLFSYICNVYYFSLWRISKWILSRFLLQSPFEHSSFSTSFIYICSCYINLFHMLTNFYDTMFGSYIELVYHYICISYLWRISTWIIFSFFLHSPFGHSTIFTSLIYMYSCYMYLLYMLTNFFHENISSYIEIAYYYIYSWLLLVCHSQGSCHVSCIQR